MTNCKFCNKPIKWVRIESNQGINGIIVKHHAVDPHYKKFNELTQGDLVAVRRGAKWYIEKVSFPNKIPGRDVDDYEKRYRARIGHPLHVFYCGERRV